MHDPFRENGAPDSRADRAWSKRIYGCAQGVSIPMETRHPGSAAALHSVPGTGASGCNRIRAGNARRVLSAGPARPPDTGSARRRTVAYRSFDKISAEVQRRRRNRRRTLHSGVLSLSGPKTRTSSLERLRNSLRSAQVRRLEVPCVNATPGTETNSNPCAGDFQSLTEPSLT